MPVFLYAISIFISIPIGLNIGNAMGKPIVILFSDFFAIIGLFFALKCRSVYVWKLFFLFLLLFIVFLISNIISIVSDVLDAQAAILSFLREFRSVPIVFLGFFVGNKYAHEFERRFDDVLFITPFMLVISDMLLKVNWPYGRWGGTLFGFDIVGFPNAVGILYVLLFALCLYKALTLGGKWIFSSLLWMIIICLLGSRIALAASLMVFISMIVLDFRKGVLLCCMIVAGFLFSSIVLDVSQLFGLYLSKISRVSTEGILGARASIFFEVYQAISERPFLGYGYAPVAGYLSEFSSAHNLYLNIIFRLGLLGAFAYFLFWGYILFVFWKARVHFKPLLFGFMACLIGGFTQATLDYNGVSVFLFFFFGVISATLRLSKVNSWGVYEGSKSIS